MKLHGIVKWFKPEKGYGFVSADNIDYFVHFANILGDGFKTLSKDQKVEFTPSKGAKGLTATEVSVIS